MLEDAEVWTFHFRVRATVVSGRVVGAASGNGRDVKNSWIQEIGLDLIGSFHVFDKI